MKYDPSFYNSLGDFFMLKIICHIPNITVLKNGNIYITNDYRIAYRTHQNMLNLIEIQKFYKY